jgi:excisionase family DNA binding protein
MNETTVAFLTPPEIAKLLRVSNEKVYGWIRRGDLRAVNVGNKTRPRFRIAREHLDSFLESRTVPPPPPRQRRQKQPPLRPVVRPEGGPIDPKLGEELLKKGQAKKVGNVYFRIWNGMTLYL